MKHTRGFSTIELIISATIALLVIGGAAGVLRMGNIISSKTLSESRAKEMLSQAVAKMAPSIRLARGVDMDESSATLLDVVLPEKDQAGRLTMPLQDGDDVMFYLSDITGDPDAQGTILWRAVNGEPDAKWSLRSGKPAIDLKIDGLRFEYHPDQEDPDSVQILLSTMVDGRRVTLTRNLNSKISMRNHKTSKEDENDDDTDDTTDAS